ncbi:MAG: glycoside hydrolase family 9 protein [Oscillospiraceae bacterium]|nr:glycoside hydrolase family 9 protein [Oscillospiraceae bacterium]
MNSLTKRIVSAATAIVLASTGMSAFGTGSVSNEVNAAGNYNYTEALQKSMFFYEVQQSGKLPEWNSVQWRGDSMVNEDGEETDFVPGGWFDAGDHFKFALTNAYSASIMGWGYIEYKDAVDKAGLGEIYRNNIQWAFDYVMGCDQGDGKVVGTIGDFTGGSTDHNIWCSAEVYLRKHHLNSDDWVRPYDIIENASVAGLCAAALAEGYIIFKDEQPEKAAEYLKHAKDLFENADKIRDVKDIGGMAGMYNTQSWIDDLMYAANWLYIATGDQSYLDKCKNEYIPEFPTENQSTDRKFTWGLCWDDTSQAAAYLYAVNTGEKEWIEHVSHHLDYWIDGYGGKKVDYTPDGLAWLFNWGSARHATTTAWLAKLSSDTIFKDDAALSKKYNDWAKSQLDYCFGDNDLGMSYVLGMGDLQPTAFHHRTASGIHDDHWNELGQESGGVEGWQTEYAHTLYGALVGGPDKAGQYENAVAKYEYSEVAIDYNAGYTAALCAMVDDFGGEKLADFPVKETPKWAEWEVAAVLNGSGDSYTEIKAWAMNHTAWPARVEKDVCYRYFFDVSEVIEGGLSVDDIKIEAKSQQYSEGEQGFATVSGPFKYEGDSTGNTYYAEIKFEDARAIQPTGQSEHRDEVQFRVSIPDAVDGKPTKGCWDPSNDWSYKGVEDATSLKSPDSLNDHITMYVNGNLVWGTEPDGTVPGDNEPVVTTPAVTTPAPVQTTPSVTTENTPAETTNPVTTENTTPEKEMLGDVNLDGKIDVTDLSTLSIILADNKPVSGMQKKNADVDRDGNVYLSDLARIRQYLSKIIEKF